MGFPFGEANLKKKLENAFKAMYSGKDASINYLNLDVIHVFEDAYLRGYLTHNTYGSIRDKLENAYNSASYKVISVDSEEITVVDKETGNKDTFSLEDYISFIIDVFTSDPVFHEKMNDHKGYAGVMWLLEEASGSGRQVHVNPDDSENILLVGDYIFTVEMNDEDEYELYRYSSEAGAYPPDKSLVWMLSGPELFPDKEKGGFYANGSGGACVRFDESGLIAEVIPGKIMAMTGRNEIVLYDDDHVVLQKSKDDRVTIGHMVDILINPKETEELSWVEDDIVGIECKRCENGIIKDDYVLKAEIVWRHLLNKAYSFKKNSEGLLSYDLWMNKCSRLPVPFTAGSILDSIKLIESHIFDGWVEKADDYTDIMLPVLSLEGSDEDLTDKLFDKYNITGVASNDWKIAKHPVRVLKSIPEACRAASGEGLTLDEFMENIDVDKFLADLEKEIKKDEKAQKLKKKDSKKKESKGKKSKKKDSKDKKKGKKGKVKASVLKNDDWEAASSRYRRTPPVRNTGTLTPRRLPRRRLIEPAGMGDGDFGWPGANPFADAF